VGASFSNSPHSVALAMSVLKRSCSFLAELLAEDPHQMKRFRTMADLSCDDVVLPTDVATALASAVDAMASASASASSPDAVTNATRTCVAAASEVGNRGGIRRQHDSMDECDVDTEMPWEKPMEKRRRQAGEDAASLRPWAQKLVSALHGCPSVEAAFQRCEPVLMEFGAQAETRGEQRVTAAGAQCHREKAAQSEALPHEQQGGDPCDGTSPLRYETKILKRAVIHLADRCRKMEAKANASAEKVAMLQQALEQSHESQRRSAHSKEMLETRLCLQMNGMPRF